MPAFALAAIIGQPAVQALSDSLFASAPVDTTIIHNTDSLIGAETIISGNADGIQSAGVGAVSDGPADMPQVPEAPATDGFAPTMMSDLEAADPTTGLTFITPPTANNRGTTSLTYPLQMPPARNGMQPQIALSYSSDGGSGWLGEGWDIDVPAITVDTRWGVPRYDSANETETYLLNGQMLCFTGSDGQMHVAHRGTPEAREVDRRFFTRQGGDFSKIVRKGSSPSDYYWEVTDTRGTKYVYGQSSNSRLQGTVGGSVVTAEWRLCRIEELHGDYISYEYAKEDEKSLGSLPTTALYLSKVKAGNSNKAAHTIATFHRSTASKHISRSSARYGFLTSSDALLDSVNIEFRGSPFRSYSLHYGEGAFHREHLEAIHQYDAVGQLASFQRFDYYDDTEGGTRLLTDASTVALPDAGLTPPFPVSAVNGDFSNVPTALGGTISTSWGTSLYAGVGSNNGSPMKDGTVGFAVSYGQDSSEGRATLIDINGDGLPDNVYRSGSGVWFCPGVQTDSLVSYGQPRQVNGLSHIQKTKTSSLSGGFKEVIGSGLSSAMVGSDYGKTTTKTTDYFLDINGDGLPDMVSGGHVLFNHMETADDGTAIPVFTEHSDDTDSPVQLSGTMADDIYTLALGETDSLLKYSPKIDLVRVWEAPRDGTVTLAGIVKRLPPTGSYDADAYDQADCLRVAIQTGGQELWQKSIDKGDGSTYTYNKTLTVQKGQRVFFRLQSGHDALCNGDFDKVLWRPLIRYTAVSDGRSQPATPYWSGLEYSLDSCRLLSTAGQSYYVGGRPFKLQGSILVPKNLPCDVTVSLESENLTDPIATWKLHRGRPNITVQPLLGTYSNKAHLESVRLVFSSPAELDWSKFVQYVRLFSQPTADSQDTTVIIPYVRTFADIKRFAVPITLVSDSVTITPAVITDGTLLGKITMAALVEGDTARFSQKGAAGLSPVHITGKSGKRLWVTYYYDGELAANPSLPTQFSSGASVPITIYEGLSARREADEWGHHYRGWDAIAYNTRCSGSSLIDEALLSQPLGTTRMKDGTAPVYPLSVEGDIEGLSLRGPHRNVYCALDTMSAGRLSQQDVRGASPVETALARYAQAQSAGQSDVAIGITQIAENTTTTGMSGISLGTANVSTGGARTRLTMMDMNGDGYPDIVGDGRIQYTLPTGGLSTDHTLADSEATIDASSESYAVGLGGDPVRAYSTIASLIPGGKASGNSRKVTDSPFTVQGSTGTNSDEAYHSFVDINGDGLPDKVRRTAHGGQLQAALNLGYGFTPYVTVGPFHIQQGTTTTTNLGGGVSLCSGSFSAGLSLTGSSTEEHSSLTDINGDGLPDYVTCSDGVVKARLGNGTGFDGAETILSGANYLSHSSSTALGGSAAYTACFPLLGVKIVVNPSVNTARSLYRPRAALMDIDGDGYPDYVESESETQMTVHSSAIRRTGKLRSVRNSLGGTFTIDYAHSTPTYGLPGGKWVMSCVSIDDGIHDDGPVQRTRFEYRNGRRDRHEREFLGFGEVETIELDTENGDAPYRRTVEEYDVSSVYAQGNLLSTAVMDAGGNLYTKTTNSYYGYLLKADSNGKYSFTDKTGNNLPSAIGGAGMAYCPLKFTEARQYDADSSNGRIMSQELYNYEVNPTSLFAGSKQTVFGALIAEYYSDKGTLSSKGTGYQQLTRYTWSDMPGKNIVRRLSSVSSYGTGNDLLSQTNYVYPAGDTANCLLPTEVKRLAGNRSSLRYATTNYTYDAYGNVIHMLQPANHRRQRMGYSYEYDAVMHMYVTGINDSLGLHSHVTRIDYATGTLLERIGINNGIACVYLDAMGRPIRHVSPMERSRVSSSLGYDELPSSLYTVRYEYHPIAEVNSDGSIAKPAYAVTQHYDVLSVNGPVETVTFVDGFGRPIQVKKESVISGVRRFVDSGKAVYDAFGRVKASYYPVAESVGKRLVYNSIHDTSASPTKTIYDILDRPVKETLPDGNSSTTAYTLTECDGQNVVQALTTDPLGHKRAVLTNGSGLNVASIRYKEGDVPITTTFAYDGLQRISTVTDAEGNKTSNWYDLLGRRSKVSHPASGTTTYTYDNAGNLRTMQTANLYAASAKTSIFVPDTLRPSLDTVVFMGHLNVDAAETNVQDITADGFTPGIGKPSVWPIEKLISYSYNFGQLDSVTYPLHPENNVSYFWGSHGSGNNAGRLVGMADATGVSEYEYDVMGNKTSERRIMALPYVVKNTAKAAFLTNWAYDSFGRLLSMGYPDGQTVYYGYNAGGQLTGVTGALTAGHDRANPDYTYVSSISYDKFGSRTRIVYGNGTSCQLSYDPDRRWLTQMATKKGSSSLWNYSYTYDAVGNIASMTDGLHSMSYEYDSQDRLTGASSATTAMIYSLSVAYDDMTRVVSKSHSIRKMPPQAPSRTYYDQLSYTYRSGIARQHFQLDAIEELCGSSGAGLSLGEVYTHNFSYDHNGNLTADFTSRKKDDGHTEPMALVTRYLWDEDNRLTALSENGYVSTYWYDGNGNRAIKLHGGNTSQFRNGAMVADSTQSITSTDLTIYASPYYVVHAGPGGWEATKHIFAGDERIVSQVKPDGTKVFPDGSTDVAVAGIDLAALRNRMTQTLADSYQQLGVPYEGSDTVASMVKPRKAGDLPDVPSTAPELCFYYHKDHLGSTGIVTDADGNIAQYLAYTPYGEVLYDAVTDSTFISPYKFNGKEHDAETGMIYYGARYYNPKYALWLSCDPLQEKYPGVSSYSYTLGNPVRMIDIGGLSVSEFDESGDYIRTIKDNWWHNLWHGRTGRIIDESGNTIKSFRFADPKNDVQDLKKGKLRRLYFVSSEDVENHMSGVGVFKSINKAYNHDIRDRYNYIMTGGIGGGKLDFSLSVIKEYYDSPDQTLFLVDNVAHNRFNYGNFLFGVAGNALGYSLEELQLGAHYNSLFNSEYNGYAPQLDSRDDQRSIKLGYYYGNIRNYKNKFYKVIVESITKEVLR